MTSTSIVLQPGDSVTVSAPAPSSVVRSVSPGIGVAAFEALCADPSIDVIELNAGTYRNWRACDITADRTARPLTIRPASGATVIFDAANDGNYGDAPFRLTGARHVTFEGRFVFQHYLLAQAGLFTLIDCSFVTVRGVTVRNCAANAVSTAQSSHVVYVSHDCHDLVFDDFDVARVQAIDEPGGRYGLNGLHLYAGDTDKHPEYQGTIRNVAAHGWVIDGANWAFVARNASAGLLVDGWAVSNSGRSVPAAMDFGSDNTGRVANCRVTGSIGLARILGRVTDAGGNVWA